MKEWSTEHLLGLDEPGDLAPAHSGQCRGLMHCSDSCLCRLAVPEHMFDDVQAPKVCKAPFSLVVAGTSLTL